MLQFDHSIRTICQHHLNLTTFSKYFAIFLTHSILSRVRVFFVLIFVETVYVHRFVSSNVSLVMSVSVFFKNIFKIFKRFSNIFVCH